MTKPEFAPGCFGSALAFDEKSSLCMDCVFKDGCEPIHNQNVIEFRKKLGVVKVGSSSKVIQKDESGMVLSKRMLKILEKIDNSNLKIKEKLSAGENPFADSKVTYFETGGLAALRLKRFTQADMTKVMRRRHKVTHSTASFYARSINQILTHVGAFDQIDGVYYRTF